ncbi:MAG: hypothetical protein ACKVON_02645 [Beijerinckiaceae bacterium]
MMMRFAFPLTVVMTLGLAACGGGIPGFGGSSTPEVTPSGSSQGAGSGVRNLLLYGGTTVPPARPAETVENDYTCPTVGVLENGAAFRSGGTSASGLSYQASLVGNARECAFQGKQVSIRVGVEGRLLLGTDGRPGTFTVPVRIVVKRRADIVTQRFAQVRVTVPVNETQAEFSYIQENITVPIGENDPGEEYDIFVGFDATGAQAQRQTRRR